MRAIVNGPRSARPRRAERQKQGGGDGAQRRRAPAARGDVDPILAGPRRRRRATETRAAAPRPIDRGGAPPQDLGFSDETLEHSPLKEGTRRTSRAGRELEDYDFEDEEQPLEEPATAGRAGCAAAARPRRHHRNRLVAFLIAVWAELQRVQWPNRKQLTQMTGIVLVFVLIAGGYLGLLDAIFSRLIQQII